MYACVCVGEESKKKKKQTKTNNNKKRWFQKFTIKRTHGRFCNTSIQEGAFSANLQPSFPANAPLKEEDQKKVLTHNNLSRPQNALIRARARNTSRHSGEGLRLGDELHPWRLNPRRSGSKDQSTQSAPEENCLFECVVVVVLLWCGAPRVLCVCVDEAVDGVVVRWRRINCGKAIAMLRMEVSARQPRKPRAVCWRVLCACRSLLCSRQSQKSKVFVCVCVCIRFNHATPWTNGVVLRSHVADFKVQEDARTASWAMMDTSVQRGFLFCFGRPKKGVEKAFFLVRVWGVFSVSAVFGSDFGFCRAMDTDAHTFLKRQKTALQDVL